MQGNAGQRRSQGEKSDAMPESSLLHQRDQQLQLTEGKRDHY